MGVYYCLYKNSTTKKKAPEFSGAFHTIIKSTNTLDSYLSTVIFLVTLLSFTVSL